MTHYSKVDGLTIAYDESGNASITNSKNLDKQIDVLDLLKQQAIITGNTQMEMAISTAQTIHNGTMMTIEDMKDVIKGQQILSQALANTSAGKNGFFDVQQEGINLGIKNLEDSVAKMESLKSKFKMDLPTTSSSGGKGYTPPKKEDDDKVTKQTKKDIDNLEIISDKYYKIEGALQNVNNELDRNNKLQSNAEGKTKLTLMEDEIKLLEDKKVILTDLYKAEQQQNRENSKKILDKGFKIDNTTGQISNKNELLTSMTNKANRLTGDDKEKAIANIKSIQDLIQTYEDNFLNGMKDTSSKIFDVEQARINKLAELEESKFNQKLDNINKTYGSDSQEIENIKYKLEEINALGDDSTESLQEKVKYTGDLIKATEKYNENLLQGYSESLNLLNSTKQGSSEWETANELVEDYRDKLKDTNLDLINFNNSLENIAKEKLNNIQDTQEKIKEAIKKRYEEEQKIAKETVEKNKKEREKEHKDTIDKLNDQKKAYEDFYQTKLNNLDREKNQGDYKSKIDDLIKDKMKLQKEYDSLLMDDSLGAKARREELKEELEKVQESIAGEQFDRNIELQKNNLNDLADAQSDRIDNEIEKENDLYEQKEQELEDELKRIDKKYEKLTSEENLYRESTKALLNNQYVTQEGHIIKLTDLITTFTDTWGEGLSAVGDKIKTEITDNLTKAQEALGVDPSIGKAEKEKVKGMAIGSVYYDGNIVDLNTINRADTEESEKYKNAIENAKSAYIKYYDGEIKNLKTGKVESFSQGGVIDYTGKANVHGSPNNAEVVFNSKQASWLYNFVTKQPSQLLNSNNEQISRTPRLPQSITSNNTSEVTLSVANLVNIEGNVDKNALPDVEDISKKVLTNIQKELNKKGFFKKV